MARTQNRLSLIDTEPTEGAENRGALKPTLTPPKLGGLNCSRGSAGKSGSLLAQASILGSHLSGSSHWSEALPSQSNLTSRLVIERWMSRSAFCHAGDSRNRSPARL